MDLRVTSSGVNDPRLCSVVLVQGPIIERDFSLCSPEKDSIFVDGPDAIRLGDKGLVDAACSGITDETRLNKRPVKMLTLIFGGIQLFSGEIL